MITNALKRTTTGEMIEAKAANIQGDMVSCASHYLFAEYEGNKTLTWSNSVTKIVVFVSLWSMTEFF